MNSFCFYVPKPDKINPFILLQHQWLSSSWCKWLSSDCLWS